jgi:hypothetical protein
MPWEHCGESVLDTEACPACGLSKAEWTLEIEVTRTFLVSNAKRKKRKRDAWIEVQLLDSSGEPVADADYRIRLPSSKVAKGALDAEGKARVEEIRGGTCLVEFPDYLDEGEERETGESHIFELEEAEFRFSY